MALTPSLLSTKSLLSTEPRLSSNIPIYSVWSYEAIVYASVLWCQDLPVICHQSGSWRWLSVEMRKASSTPEATDLLEVNVIDKMCDPLDAAGSALWWRRTSALDCSLWCSGGEASRLHNSGWAYPMRPANE